MEEINLGSQIFLKTSHMNGLKSPTSSQYPMTHSIAPCLLSSNDKKTNVVWNMHLGSLHGFDHNIICSQIPTFPRQLTACDCARLLWHYARCAEQHSTRPRCTPVMWASTKNETHYYWTTHSPTKNQNTRLLDNIHSHPNSQEA